MRAEHEDQFPLLSQSLYERLLAVYPRKHREEYGPAMTQLFRDQSREAWSNARSLGLVALWLRILPDLLRTSLLEHIDNLKGKKIMASKISGGARSHSAARNAFFAVFLLVFGVVFMTSIIITYILPETYASTARIMLERNRMEGDLSRMKDQGTANNIYDPNFIQKECVVIQSEMILDKAIDQLNLNEKWGKKYALDSKLKTSECRQMLKNMLEVRPVRNTSIIDVKVSSDDRSEAATIANTLVQIYQVHRMDEINQRNGDNSLRVTIIEHAEPGARPVRPNHPLNIFMGAVYGTLLGVLAGVIAAFLITRFKNKLAASPPPLAAT